MHRLIHLTCLLAIAGLVHAQEDLTAKIDGIAAGYHKERGFMGSLLVAKDGKVLLEKGYGAANLEWDVPNAPDTKFRLGSITKQFTATAILQLEEQGKLSLSDPICRYVPECPEAWQPITVHHLMNHTSGIPSYTGLPEFKKLAVRRTPQSPIEIVMMSKDEPLEFKPGDGYNYNNTGYVLLGHIIEKVSGEKYDAYMKAHVFDPLGMKDTGYDWSSTLVKRRAAGYTYSRDRKSYENAEYLDMSLPHAAGSLYSTVRDLYAWDRALAAGKLLKKESYARMFTPGLKDYGFGWIIDKEKGRARVRHGGGIFGFSTVITRFPEQDAVVIVLSNVANADPGGVSARAINAVFGEPIELPWARKSITLDARIYERYTGKYALRDFSVTVAVQDGKLMALREGQPARELLPESETRFFLRDLELAVEFVTGSDGRASEMVLRQGSQEARGKRVEP